MSKRRQAVRIQQDQCFKGRPFNAEVILWSVRWYLMFPISYRDLELMLLDQRLSADQDLFLPSMSIGTRLGRDRVLPGPVG